MVMAIFGAHRGSFADEADKSRTVNYAKLVTLQKRGVEDDKAKGLQAAEISCEPGCIDTFKGPGLYECGFTIKTRKSGVTIHVTNIKQTKAIEVAGV